MVVVVDASDFRTRQNNRRGWSFPDFARGNSETFVTRTRAVAIASKRAEPTRPTDDRADAPGGITRDVHEPPPGTTAADTSTPPPSRTRTRADTQMDNNAHREDRHMSPESQHKSPTQQVSWAALEPHDVNTMQNLTALTQLRKTPGKKVPPGGSRSEAPPSSSSITFI